MINVFSHKMDQRTATVVDIEVGQPVTYPSYKALLCCYFIIYKCLHLYYIGTCGLRLAI